MTTKTRPTNTPSGAPKATAPTPRRRPLTLPSAALAVAIVRWWRRQLLWVAAWTAPAAIAATAGGQPLPALLVALGPGAACAIAQHHNPDRFERIIDGPLRRWRLRRRIRKVWPALATATGLRTKQGPTSRLIYVDTTPTTTTLTIAAVAGQTVHDLEEAAPALRTWLRGHHHQVNSHRPGVVTVAVSMIDGLTHPRAAVTPQQVEWESVPMGRHHDGTPWRLKLLQRHTLVVGCSGSGKGSIFWSVCGGLAPAVASGHAQLWGIDLKRGLEIGMGRGMFHRIAVDPAEALDVLREVLAVIEERGKRMAGVSRLHEPTQDEPLHLVAIDELAILTAYTDSKTKVEGTKLLSEVLTQGRAVGVLVLACVQDPRKEIVGIRGLFTQTIALRLRSSEEVRMVLGEGTADRAPCHRISPASQGAGYVVSDDGAVERVRADFWSDELVKSVSQRVQAIRSRATDTDTPRDVEGTAADRGDVYPPPVFDMRATLDAREARGGGERSAGVKEPGERIGHAGSEGAPTGRRRARVKLTRTEATLAASLVLALGFGLVRTVGSADPTSSAVQTVAQQVAPLKPSTVDPAAVGEGPGPEAPDVDAAAKLARKAGLTVRSAEVTFDPFTESVASLAMGGTASSDPLLFTFASRAAAYGWSKAEASSYSYATGGRTGTHWWVVAGRYRSDVDAAEKALKKVQS